MRGVFDRVCVLHRLKTFLDKLLWDRETHPEDIYRVKGSICIKGEDRRHMVQVGLPHYASCTACSTQHEQAWALSEQRRMVEGG